MELSVTPNNIHIKDSCKVSKSNFRNVINIALDMCPDYPERSVFGMVMEWTTHNFLYNVGYKRERTKDVDLDSPQKWYMTTAYILFGLLVWLFIR